jgi:phenolic acid decarboxylase
MWNAWLPVDISVGADNLSRVLWTYPNGIAVLWSLNRTSGSYTQGPVFGPYEAGLWHATRIACGKDGIGRVLWTEPDGTLSLWWLNADNTYKESLS